MNKKFGIREVVAAGIGTALFAALTTVQIPTGIPNTSLQIRMAVLAFFSAIFGPAVGAIVGFIGHAIGDAIFYNSIWWSWVFPELVIGIAIGVFANKFAVREGGFDKKNVVLFNVVQVIANAVAWIVVAPVLDILIYSEPANKVFLQGATAFITNALMVGILGTILLVGYSRVSGNSSDLKVEE